MFDWEKHVKEHREEWDHWLIEKFGISLDEANRLEYEPFKLLVRKIYIEQELACDRGDKEAEEIARDVFEYVGTEEL